MGVLQKRRKKRAASGVKNCLNWEEIDEISEEKIALKNNQLNIKLNSEKLIAKMKKLFHESYEKFENYLKLAKTF